MTIPPPIPPHGSTPPGALPYASVGPRAAGTYVPTQDERTMAMLIHILLMVAWIGALILWLVKKDESSFIDHHGKQALSFFVAMLIAGLVVVALCFVCVGFFLIPLLIAAHFVFPILAALAANRGEWYVYPWVGGLIK